MMRQGSKQFGIHVKVRNSYFDGVFYLSLKVGQVLPPSCSFVNPASIACGDTDLSEASDASEDHESTVSTEGRTVTNLCFADDINDLAGEEEELAKLVELLDKAFTAYGMEISAEKTKLMTNNTRD